MRRLFTLALVAAVQGWAGPQAGELGPNVFLRGSLKNSRTQFERTGQGRVAFLGGSITEMDGYRPLVAEWLRKKFPGTDFDFINAGIASTCSTTGAFRLRDHVLSRGRVDLLCIEFAVNDDQDGRHIRRDCIRGMEGIVRQARSLQPRIDILVTYFVNPGMLKIIQSGGIPAPIAAHEEALWHYNIPAVHLAREVADRMEAGKLTWQAYGGTHPKPAGNAIAAGLIAKLLDEAWSGPPKALAESSPHPLPARPLDDHSYFQGRFLSPEIATRDGGWEWGTPEWKQLPGAFRGRFAGRKLLCARKPGAETTIRFEGRAVGAYLLAGPDAGMVEAALDGGPFEKHDLYHPYSRGLHYPRTVMFDAELDPGPHTLRLRVSGERNPNSQGHAARILQFTVN